MKASHVMLVCSIVFIVFGLYGFMADEAGNPVDLAAPAAGFILLFFSFAVNNNRPVEQAGMVITIIVGVVYLVMALDRISAHNFFIAMLSLVSVMFYVKDLKAKKAK